VTTERRFKKGEKIYSEGDQLKSLFMLQSGKVSIYSERGGQKTEVDQPMIGNVMGEQAVFGYPRQVYNAEAISEVKVVEIPLDILKALFDKTPTVYKLFIKALGDELRRLRGALRTHKMEHEAAPCPSRFIPRLAGILTLVAHHVGAKPKVDLTIPQYKLDEEKKKNPTFKDDDILLSFHVLKIYTTRMFLESPQRMQSFCELLGKLGYIHLQYELNEDTEVMELQELRIHEAQTIELFGQFYQHNFFKAGKSEVIALDKTAVKCAAGICEFAKDKEVDRKGTVQLDYQLLLEFLKSKYQFDFKEVHVGLLEKKGLFLKRQTLNEKVVMSFDLYEWTSTYKFWQILQEIDRWNEQGFVNPKENLNIYSNTVNDAVLKCQSCSGEIQANSKFCPECGAKVSNAA
jgi:CRP-like cAMP-binding protein